MVRVDVDLNKQVEAAVEAHLELLSRLPRLAELAGESASSNRDEPECWALREASAWLLPAIQDLFEHERRMIFPMLRRLAEQTMISRCRSGAVAAWVRQIVRSQDEISNAIAELRRLAAAKMSPAGPCESCQELLRQVEEVSSGFARLIDVERRGLFRWAVAREQELIHKTA